jgi:hypothetical protein
MPWRGPDYAGEFPSLGWEIIDWARDMLTVPDGPFAGERFEFTDEQAATVVRFYQLDDRGGFVCRRGCLRRAQGWGKSPVMSVFGLVELCGPCRFGGWDAAGDPVGVLPGTPWVQVAAGSEDQAGNTFAAIHAMAGESALADTVLDVGLTRIFLKDVTGRLEPVTAAAGTRLGQRVTFAVLDETHLWTRRSGGHKLAATIRRNAGKMNGRTFESTNAHEPGEASVAESTFEASQKGAAGLLYDSVEAPLVDDLTDRAAVLPALRVAYGDARWVDLDRIASEIADPATDPSDARRFYFNQLTSDSLRPVDLLEWEQLARADVDVPARSYVGVGFDGSISDDMTVLYGCTQDGHLFEIASWGRPENAASDWRVPRLEVGEKVAETFARYRVGRMFCDPAKWYSEIEQWALDHGEEKVVVLDTNQARRFAPACGRFVTAVREGTVTHDGGSGLTAHLAACAKKKVRLADADDDGRTQFVFVKGDVRKIDRAVAAVLAFEAASTMPPRKKPRIINLDEALREAEVRV